MKELILLGKGLSMKDCPYDTEVWVVSSVLGTPDARFDCISKAFAFDDFKVDKEYIHIAKKHNIPLVSTRSYFTEPYPTEGIRQAFKINYFRNSISYMIAMAIYQGYEKLRLYGVDQGPEWDYITTRPYVMFWLGVAVGRGVRFELTENSLLMEPLISAIKKQIEEDTERVREWLPRKEALCLH